MKRLLILCTGNYYRSRFAEIFFNWHAEQRNLSWKAESKGLAVNYFNPGPISRYTMARLIYHGIPVESSQRFPIEVTQHDFSSADHVIAVSQSEHQPLIQARFPDWLEGVEFWDIQDLHLADPELAIAQLEREVMGLLERLANLTAASAGK